MTSRDFGVRDFKLVRSVLLADWDPIGIAGEPAAQDEYDGVARAIALRLLRDEPVDLLAQYLIGAERDMGLAGEVDRARLVAEKLTAICRT